MTVQVGLCRTWSESTLLIFSRGSSFFCIRVVDIVTKDTYDNLLLLTQDRIHRKQTKASKKKQAPFGITPSAFSDENQPERTHFGNEWFQTSTREVNF